MKAMVVYDCSVKNYYLVAIVVNGGNDKLSMKLPRPENNFVFNLFIEIQRRFYDFHNP